MPNKVSHAMRSFMYGNPADIVEQKERHDLGCKACKSAERVWSALRCGDVRNESQHGVPRIGHKCKFFKERG